MRRYFEIYALLWRNSLIREMAFKANFLLWIATDLLWFLGQVLFIDVIFRYTGRIGDWTKWDMVLLAGTHQIIAQLFQAFFYVNLSNLPELVRTGRLDLMLLLPMDAQFAVSTRQFGLDSLVNAGVGVAFVIFSLGQLHVVPAAAQVACYLAALVLGVTVHYAIMLMLAAASFWIVRAQGLIYGYFNIINLARYPDQVFRGMFKVVFTWIIPVLVVANVPARILVHAFERPLDLLTRSIAAAALALALSRLCWRLALRRYSSASS